MLLLLIKFQLINSKIRIEHVNSLIRIKPYDGIREARKQSYQVNNNNQITIFNPITKENQS